MNKPTAVRQWENEEGKYFIPDNSCRSSPGKPEPDVKFNRLGRVALREDALRRGKSGLGQNDQTGIPARLTGYPFDFPAFFRAARSSFMRAWIQWGSGATARPWYPQI